MDIFAAAERLMGMDARAWARHANPWSGYSRMAGAPLVFFAFWSVYWIEWYAIITIVAALFWVWVNPRLFPPPATTTSWATKGALGERVYLNRKRVPIPEDHARAAIVTTLFSAAFFAIMIYGFIVRDFWAAFTGYHGAVLAKIWFVDRMVWLWESKKDSHPIYQKWDRAEWEADID